MASLLRTGSKGTEVTRVQHILNKIKIAKTPLKLDGDFGPKTLDAVKAFQLSEGTAADGIVGPETEKRMVQRYRGVQPGKRNGTPPVSHDHASFGIVETATQIALSQLQVREVPLGSNSGPAVDSYNRAARASKGSFWCMSFVYWCFVQASVRTHESNPMPRTAACDYLYDWAKGKHKLTRQPQRGDIFLVKGGEYGHCHTGIVTGAQGGSVRTIEGNTNNDGSSNGIGVFARTRSVGSCDFVRLGVARSHTDNPHSPLTSSGSQIAWGAKVSGEFKAKVIAISKELHVDPSFLMACMAFETGETFSPSVRNGAGSGAVGLIQFMPDTAKGLGTSTSALAGMSDVAQLDYVKKYLKPNACRLKTLEDLYMSILYPAAIGKAANSTLFPSGTANYSQNRGFDADRDARITPGEVSSLVRAAYNKGMRPGNLG